MYSCTLLHSSEEKFLREAFRQDLQNGLQWFLRVNMETDFGTLKGDVFKGLSHPTVTVFKGNVIKGVVLKFKGDVLERVVLKGGCPLRVSAKGLLKGISR